MAPLLLRRRLTAHRRRIRTCANRGISERDVELIATVGTQVEDGAFILRRQDVAREVRDLKRRIQSLERLRDARAVVVGETVVTAYRAGRHSQRATLRRARVDAWRA